MVIPINSSSSSSSSNPICPTMSSSKNSSSSSSSSNIKKISRISSLQERKASLTKGERSKGKYYYQSRLFKLFVFIKSIQFFLGFLTILLKQYIPIFHPLTEQLFKDVKRNSFLDYLILPMVSWDSIYFINIARNGYRFEQEHAFFPLLPAMMNRGALILEQFFPNTNNLILISITGILISFLSLFIFSSNVYTLTILMGSSYKFAFISSCFVLISPALPFLHSIYTESLFGALATSGMIYLVRATMISDKHSPFTAGFQSWKWKILAVLMFSLASATRSNGFLLSGFFLNQAFLSIIMKDSPFKEFSLIFNIWMRVYYCSSYISYAFCTIIPFISFQTWGYWHYCVDEGPTRPWCNAILPNIYSYVQRKYWNVGFLRYWTVEQIPNFIIALPIIIISFLGIWMFFGNNPLCSSSSGSDGSCGFRKFIESPTTPHVFLLTFMFIYSLFNTHIQIITRLFSFQPIIYWVMAILYFRCTRSLKISIVCYSLLIGLIGTFLFQHHSPPA